MWGEVPVPEDLEAGHRVRQTRQYLDDDEDFAADGSGGEVHSWSDLDVQD